MFTPEMVTWYLAGLAFIGFGLVTFALVVNVAVGFLNKLIFKFCPFWAGVYILVPTLHQFYVWYYHIH